MITAYKTSGLTQYAFNGIYTYRGTFTPGGGAGPWPYYVNESGMFLRMAINISQTEFIWCLSDHLGEEFGIYVAPYYPTPDYSSDFNYSIGSLSAYPPALPATGSGVIWSDGGNLTLVDLNRYYSKDNAQTTLTANYSIGATSLNIVSSSALSANCPFLLTIDVGTVYQEVVAVINNASNVLTTTPTIYAHSSSAVCQMRITSEGCEANNNLIQRTSRLQMYSVADVIGLSFMELNTGYPIAATINHSTDVTIEDPNIIANFIDNPMPQFEPNYYYELTVQLGDLQLMNGNQFQVIVTMTPNSYLYPPTYVYIAWTRKGWI